MWPVQQSVMSESNLIISHETSQLHTKQTVAQSLSKSIEYHIISFHNAFPSNPLIQTKTNHILKKKNSIPITYSIPPPCVVPSKLLNDTISLGSPIEILSISLMYINLCEDKEIVFVRRGLFRYENVHGSACR